MLTLANGSSTTDSARTVLVVDDDADIRMLIRLHLERAGYSVDEAVDGRDALEQLDERRDIGGVLLDLRMPDVDGYAVIEALRERGQLSTIPIVTCSAHADPEIVRRLEAAGTQGHVGKPFKPAQLIAAVEQMFERHAET